MSKRDATKAETKWALVDAGLAEFAERGLDAPSLDAICARAGFTRGAFYVHFADREALLIAVMERVMRAWLDVLVETADPSHDLLRTVDGFTNAFLAILGETPPPPALAHGALQFHLVLEACHRSPVVRTRFVEVVLEGAGRIATITRAGQTAGVVRPDVNPEQAGVLLGALLLGLLAMAQTQMPVDPQALRFAVLQLMSASAPSA